MAEKEISDGWCAAASSMLNVLLLNPHSSAAYASEVTRLLETALGSLSHSPTAFPSKKLGVCPRISRAEARAHQRARARRHVSPSLCLSLECRVVETLCSASAFAGSSNGEREPAPCALSFSLVLLLLEISRVQRTRCSWKLSPSLLQRGCVSFSARVCRLRYVDCSFPVTSANAPSALGRRLVYTALLVSFSTLSRGFHPFSIPSPPHLGRSLNFFVRQVRLVRWNGLSDSEWALDFSPAWSCELALDGRQMISFSTVVRVSGVRVAGRLGLSFSSDMRRLGIRFLEKPVLDVRVACHVTLGQVPLPIQNQLSSLIHDEAMKWIATNLVAPNELAVNLNGNKTSECTDADFQKAQKAALIGAQRAAATRSNRSAR